MSNTETGRNQEPNWLLSIHSETSCVAYLTESNNRAVHTTLEPGLSVLLNFILVKMYSHLNVWSDGVL